MAREAEERGRREEEARFMAEQQRLREQKEAQDRARAEQEESERVQRQVRGYPPASGSNHSEMFRRVRVTLHKNPRLHLKTCPNY